MEIFDESKVINCFHSDKAEVGKRYYQADDLFSLKRIVESRDREHVDEFVGSRENRQLPFVFKSSSIGWAFIYPYEEPEEPPEEMMTERMYAEWLSKGFGEGTVTGNEDDGYSFMHHAYRKKDENKPLPEYVRVRRWEETEWVKPTVDIYKRDCVRVEKD